ncbi:MAG: NnrS family protein [Hyphomonadaceae bacterium]|nr:NnrS family protein [Hyphomonadaceae bacterium]
MRGSAAQRRAWTGPAFWSLGFRPFFLFGAIWAASAMSLWIAMLTGWTAAPIRFSPVDWHAHEMLFGYLPAAIAGFLLTAVPNWTGRYPIMGWPLAGLFALWLAGRFAVFLGSTLPALAVAALDVSFLVALAAAIAREIMAGRNWRNLKVLGLIATLAIANGLYHAEALRGGSAAGGLGARLATAVAIMLIVVIGGRIVPSFTRNWLAKEAPDVPHPAPFGWFDSISMLVSLAALTAWVLAPTHIITALACLLAGLLCAVRIARWQGWRTGGEALVWVLHLGFAFVPLGFLAASASILSPDALSARAAQHAFMAGAIGVMTLAVMTRASLGHSGRALHANAAVTTVYLLAAASAVLRIASGLAGAPLWFLHAAAAAWIAAFALFAWLYAPMLLRPRPANAP